MCFHSDKFQEYRQKHQELKVAVAKELGFDVSKMFGASETVNGREKSSDLETGSGKEAEDGGSPAVENTGESQQEQPVTEILDDNAAVVLANGHAEQNQCEEGDRAAPDTEAKTVNGESEVSAAGEETVTSTANGEIKSDAAADVRKSVSDKVNGEINGDLDIATSPTVLKSKGSWADVVSKGAVANGTGDKETAVNGVADSVTANGVAEE